LLLTRITNIAAAYHAMASQDITGNWAVLGRKCLQRAITVSLSKGNIQDLRDGQLEWEETS